MKAIVKDIKIGFKSLDTAVLTVEIGKYALSYLPDVNKPMTVEIKEYRKPRSTNSNALMWELCEKLAEKMDSISKEDVYRQAVHQVGTCFSTSVPTAQAEALRSSWCARGIGWLADDLGSEEGMTSVLLYPGSSTYTTKQMARLIDFLIDECKEMGVQVENTDQR